MSMYNAPMARPGAGSMQSASQHGPSTMNTALAVGGVGLIIGAAGGLAQGFAQMRAGSMTTEQVVGHTAKEAAGTGLAAAAGAAVASSLGTRGVLGVAAMVAVGAAAKYAWDQTIAGGCVTPESAQNEAAPAAKSAKQAAK